MSLHHAFLAPLLALQFVCAIARAEDKTDDLPSVDFSDVKRTLKPKLEERKKLRQRSKSSVFAVRGLAPVNEQDATASSQGFRVGLDLGSIGLLGDMQSQGSSFGYGLALAYHFNESFAVDLDYFSASFSDVDHRDVDLGASYYFTRTKNEIYASLGASFLHNDVKATSISGDATGFFIGAGTNWELMPSVRAGLDLRFHKAPQTTAVSDSTTAMLKFTYSL